MIKVLGELLTQETLISILYSSASFAAIIIVTAIIARLSKILIRGVLRTGVPLVTTHVQQIVQMIIWIIGILLALEHLGLRLDLLLVLLGLIGLGILIAMKDMLENVASKYFSDVYVPYKVGDNIKVENYSGKVIEINPISTILLTEGQELISIPNALFLRKIVVNISPLAWKEIIIPIVIGKEINLPEFESEVFKSCNKLKMYFDERFPPILSVRRRDDKSIELALTLMVKEADKKDAIIVEINQRVKEILESMKRK